MLSEPSSTVPQTRAGLQGAGPHLLWEQDQAGLSLTDRLGPGGQFILVASSSLTDGESQMQELCVPPKLGGVLEVSSLGCRACLSPRPLQMRPRWRFAAGGHGGSLSTSGLRGVVGWGQGRNWDALLLQPKPPPPHGSSGT